MSSPVDCGAEPVVETPLSAGPATMPVTPPRSYCAIVETLVSPTCATVASAADNPGRLLDDLTDRGATGSLDDQLGLRVNHFSGRVIARTTRLFMSTTWNR